MEFLARPRKRILSIPMVLKPGLPSAGKTTHQLESSSQRLQDPGADEVSDQVIPSDQATSAAHRELVFVRSTQSQGQAGPAEIHPKMGVVRSRPAHMSCRSSQPRRPCHTLVLPQARLTPMAAGGADRGGGNQTSSWRRQLSACQCEQWLLVLGQGEEHIRHPDDPRGMGGGHFSVFSYPI